MATRGIRTFTVPISDERPEAWVLVQGNWPMTRKQWMEFRGTLDVMAVGLVEPFGDTLARLAPDVVAEALLEEGIV